MRLHLRLAAIAPFANIQRSVGIQVDVMVRMIRQHCGYAGKCEIEITYGATDLEVGTLSLQLVDHFEEEIGPIDMTIAHCLEQIGALLDIDWRVVMVEKDLGPIGTPAPPGPCDKARKTSALPGFK